MKAKEILSGYSLDNGTYEIPKCHCSRDIKTAIFDLLSSGEYVLSCRGAGCCTYNYVLLPLERNDKDFTISELHDCFEWVRGVFSNQNTHWFEPCIPVGKLLKEPKLLDTVNLVLQKSTYPTNWVNGYFPVVRIENNCLVWYEVLLIIE